MLDSSLAFKTSASQGNDAAFHSDDVLLPMDDDSLVALMDTITCFNELCPAEQDSFNTMSNQTALFVQQVQALTMPLQHQPITAFYAQPFAYHYIHSTHIYALKHTIIHPGWRTHWSK